MKEIQAVLRSGRITARQKCLLVTLIIHGDWMWTGDILYSCGWGQARKGLSETAKYLIKIGVVEYRREYRAEYRIGDLAKL